MLGLEYRDEGDEVSEGVVLVEKDFDFVMGIVEGSFSGDEHGSGVSIDVGNVDGKVGVAVGGVFEVFVEV